MEIESIIADRVFICCSWFFLLALSYNREPEYGITTKTRIMVKLSTNTMHKNGMKRKRPNLKSPKSDNKN